MQELISVFQDPVSWAALMALIVMEVVLGIDNLVFITVLTNRLPEARRSNARRIGLILALVLRLVLLTITAAIMGLTEPVIAIFGNELSWRDIILISGGLFLVWKATREIHELVDSNPVQHAVATAAAGFTVVIVQILALDMVFSIDSIVTAVGMTPHTPIMMIAVIVAVGAMMVAANPLAAFVEKNPTVVMLALGFLLLVGTALVADGFGFHIPRGYVYAAMGFSGLIELLNILARRARKRRANR
ncbi:TerC family protein [Hoeflea prorocentri]|uniref:TerC family protein n=1 Tax=Hoeflea prorocentri TaxID=1922333 RepID=A0A9X3ULQ5_9HYPH|nr:TerC family protein [Hoeflea prorocentri]MCY6382730.1 TerC family protein [Hoeflea prorocentri]MDA5400530.1 TerC family protein [Hoeflea prorocentri]